MAENHKTGRKTILNDDVSKRICSIVGDGSPEKYAADAVGIRPETICDWKRKGLNDLENGKIDSLYAQFSQDIKKAQSNIRNKIVANWSHVATTNWVAGKEFLARRDPHNFSLNENKTIEMTGKLNLNLSEKEQKVLDEMDTTKLDAIEQHAAEIIGLINE